MTQLNVGLMSICRSQTEILVAVEKPATGVTTLPPTSPQHAAAQEAIAPHVGVIPPHISTKTQQRVQNGEFVNLPDLLPEEPVEPEDYSDPTHKAGETRERTIYNFIIWLQAWSVFEGL